MTEFLLGATIIFCVLGLMALVDHVWEQEQQKKARARSLPDTWRLIEASGPQIPPPRAAGPKTSQRRCG